MLALLLLLNATAAVACEDYTSTGKHQEYVEAINDLPVYKSMVVLNDGATVFDSPEGRIVQVSLRGPAEDMASATSFYKKVLPTLGWHPRVGKFYRNKEILDMDVISEKCQTFRIDFALKPTSKE
ncbi:MAG: hypothetical protein EB060_08535 [Proteobacteria bacterium]|nr:hypothetical protein [Pseudomonadota bacterium]